MFSTYKKATGKSVLFLLALAGAALLTACEKDDEPIHDVILEFWVNTLGDNLEQVSIENIQKHIDNKSVRNIYIKPIESKCDFSNCETANLHAVRNYMQRRIDLSPKMNGMGNFVFPVGETDPQDSLWFVQHGWTINKYLQAQK